MPPVDEQDSDLATLTRLRLLGIDKTEQAHRLRLLWRYYEQTQNDALKHDFDGHNRNAGLGQWDFEQLAATMVEFDSVDWGAVGWEASELEAIIEQARVEAESPEPETTTVGEHEREIGVEHDDSEDEVPALPAEPRTKAGEVVELGPHVLHCCDCMDLLRSLPDNSIDAIVTDPPYGLSPDGRARTWDDIEALRREGKGPTGGFLGNAWDAGVPGVTWARECLRVLKPGGHMIAHSATRTVHRLTCAIEDAGGLRSAIRSRGCTGRDSRNRTTSARLSTRCMGPSEPSKSTGGACPMQA